MKKFLSFIFAVLILSVCILPICASADKAVWVLSEDGETLTCGSTVYEKYDMPPDKIYFPEGEIYLYEVENLADEYYYDYVAVDPENDGFVRLHYTEEVFVTEKGRAVLDEFRKGEYAFYLFFPENDYDVVDFTKDDFSRFIKEENKTEIDVTTIWNNGIYEIRGFDKTGTFAHNCGAVFEIQAEFYYVDFDSLDNSFFDAYGNFSYRRGMAPAYKLDEEAVKFYKDAVASDKQRTEEYIYPDEEIFLNEDDNLSAAITFWIISVLFGLVIPAVPLVLSIVFANSKKSLNPKKWYILTVCSALWILAGVGMALTFIL